MRGTSISVERVTTRRRGEALGRRVTGTAISGERVTTRQRGAGEVDWGGRSIGRTGDEHFLLGGECGNRAERGCLGRAIKRNCHLGAESDDQAERGVEV